MTETFKSYFGSRVENLVINGKFVDLVSNESVTEIIKKFQNHPSIIKIHYFLLEEFYANKSLGFGKKFNNKLRTKPG